jgi:hypothetical protein
MSARCFVCKRDWRDAKPFVEGADGFLICRRCVNDLQSQLALRVDHSASPLPSTELQVDDNPYASPIATDLAAAVRRGGEAHRGRLLGKRFGRAIAAARDSQQIGTAFAFPYIAMDSPPGSSAAKGNTTT